MTAGPTREYLDPVRFMSNASSGTIGIELAREFQSKGARVTVILGPTTISPLPQKIKIVPVVTAREMHSVVKKYLPTADVFVASAAVGDWRFEKIHKEKMKKGSLRRLTVSLVRNPDILADAGRAKQKRQTPLLLVGFALETRDMDKAAKTKMKEKNLDLVIGNTPESFSSSSIRSVWYEKTGRVVYHRKMSKKIFSKKLVSWVGRNFHFDRSRS